MGSQTHILNHVSLLVLVCFMTRYSTIENAEFALIRV